MLYSPHPHSKPIVTRPIFFAPYSSSHASPIKSVSFGLTQEEWYKEKALRILHLQRAMLLLGGPDVKWKPKLDDDNPPRFWEPLPSGPYKGKTLDRKKFEESRLEYFEAAGWNENGVPKPETLRKLGLEDVETKLRDAALIE
jgi:aldehyde:ferredoxin oxidoreductase